MSANGSKARDYRPAHIKRLFALSGNQCASPACLNSLIASDGMSNIGKICHIEAASAKGPRWNPSMDDDQRRHFNNLLILCDECHVIIDNKENEANYPTSLLQEWKRSHEEKLLLEQFEKKPTLLNIVITRLAELDIEEPVPSDSSSGEAYRIEDKIKFNNIKRNKALIDELSKFQGKLNSIYLALETERSFKMGQFLRNVNRTYLKVKGNYVLDAENSIGVIQTHADDIFEDVEEELLKLASEGHDNYAEDISYGLSLVLVDAFMRCKILEEPSHDN